MSLHKSIIPAMRIVLLFAVVFLCHNDSPAKAPKAFPQPTDTLLLPGKGVGSLRLGAPPAANLDSYKKLGLDVFINEQGNIESISISSPRFATKDGLRIGSSMSKVRKFHPKGMMFTMETDVPYRWRDRGILFIMNDNRKVVDIEIETESEYDHWLNEND